MLLSFIRKGNRHTSAELKEGIVTKSGFHTWTIFCASTVPRVGCRHSNATNGKSIWDDGLLYFKIFSAWPNLSPAEYPVECSVFGIVVEHAMKWRRKKNIDSQKSHRVVVNHMCF